MLILYGIKHTNQLRVDYVEKFKVIDGREVFNVLTLISDAYGSTLKDI